MSMYRTKGFNRLTEGGNNYKVDMLAMKQNLAQGALVVIEMIFGGSFISNMMGQSVCALRKIIIPCKRMN